MSIKLSKRSNEILARLQRSLRLSERPPLLRFALAMGIRECEGQTPKQEDSKGYEIPIKVITSGQEVLMDALIVQVLKKELEPSNRRRTYKSLVDFGLRKIMEDFERFEAPSDYLLKVARESLQGYPQQ